MHRQRHFRSKMSRAAMTLIEVVVVVALTGILMVATTSVLRNLLRTESQATTTLHLSSVQRLIAQDILNATEFKRLPTGFALRGAIATDVQCFSLHMNATVVYEIDRSYASPILWRNQPAVQLGLNAKAMKIPIAVGVGGIVLDTYDFPESATDSSSQQRWTPLPSKVQILLLDASRETMSYETLIRESQPQANLLLNRNRPSSCRLSPREVSKC